MKKRISVIITAVLAAALLTGCAENANQAPEPATDKVESSEKEEGTKEETSDSKVASDALLVTMPSGGRTLDPSAATDASSAVFVNAAYDQLVTFGTIQKDGQTIANPDDIQASLAKEWEESEDGLEYIFYLDENAKFANGDPVDADAVIYSLERVKNSNTSSFLFALTNVDKMEKIDETTVKFELTKPSVIFYKLLQMHILSIVNPKELEGVDNVDEYLQNTTAGSGAFQIEAWEPTTEATLKARTDYWKGAASIKTVKCSFIPESSNRVLLMDKGDTDITIQIPAKDLEVLAGNEALDVVSYDSNEIGYLAMNNEIEPFDNPKVREAINYAISYDSIITDIMSSRAKRLNHVIPGAMPGYIDEPGIYEYNLERAKELLKEAGYEDGFSFKLAVSNGKQEWMDTAILVKANLAEIGVDVSIERMERPQYLEAIKSKTVDAAMCTYTAFVNDPGYFFGNTLNSQGEYNYASYKNEEVDALWEKAENETDIDKRNEYLAQAQLLVEKDAPWVNLYENESVLIFNKDIKEFVYFPDAALRFYQIKK